MRRSLSSFNYLMPVLLILLFFPRLLLQLTPRKPRTHTTHLYTSRFADQTMVKIPTTLLSSTCYPRPITSSRITCTTSSPNYTFNHTALTHCRHLAQLPDLNPTGTGARARAGPGSGAGPGEGAGSGSGSGSGDVRRSWQSQARIQARPGTSSPRSGSEWQSGSHQSQRQSLSQPQSQRQSTSISTPVATPRQRPLSLMASASTSRSVPLSDESPSSRQSPAYQPQRFDHVDDRDHDVPIPSSGPRPSLITGRGTETDRVGAGGVRAEHRVGDKGAVDNEGASQGVGSGGDGIDDGDGIEDRR